MNESKVLKPMVVIAALLITGTVGMLVRSATAGPVKPVTTGKVVRGVTLPGPPGPPGTSTGRQCDFSGESVSQTGHLEDASVNCGSDNVAALVGTLPARFNAHCVADVSRLGGRLIPAPLPGNRYHCSLSALTPRDATQKFGGAVW
jgi:hypothetical protein